MSTTFTDLEELVSWELSDHALAGCRSDHGVG
jgi:hypothetical protein